MVFASANDFSSSFISFSCFIYFFFFFILIFGCQFSWLAPLFFCCCFTYRIVTHFCIRTQFSVTQLLREIWWRCKQFRFRWNDFFFLLRFIWNPSTTSSIQFTCVELALFRESKKKKEKWIRCVGSCCFIIDR